MDIPLELLLGDEAKGSCCGTMPTSSVKIDKPNFAHLSAFSHSLHLAVMPGEDFIILRLAPFHENSPGGGKSFSVDKMFAILMAARNLALVVAPSGTEDCSPRRLTLNP